MYEMLFIPLLVLAGANGTLDGFDDLPIEFDEGTLEEFEDGVTVYFDEDGLPVEFDDDHFEDLPVGFDDESFENFDDLPVRFNDDLERFGEPESFDDYLPAAFNRDLSVDHNSDTWSFFEAAQEGDAFEYKVCDPSFKDSYTAHLGLCYSLSLEIQNTIFVNKKLFYFIKATTGQDDEKSTDRLFLIDGVDYKIHYIFLEDRDYAESLQKTIFWRNWGEVIDTRHGASTINLQEYDDSTAMIISERVIAENGQVEHTALYKNFETSRFTINDAVYMPISAEIFTNGATADTTLPLFSLELIDYNIQNFEFEIEEGQSRPEIINSHHEVEWK